MWFKWEIIDKINSLQEALFAERMQDVQTDEQTYFSKEMLFLMKNVLL